jgi:alkane 1-monooxygenase
MSSSAVRYLSVLTVPLTAVLAFHGHGWLSLLPLFYAFGLVPLAELVLPPDSGNPSEEEALIRGRNPFYELPLYMTVPVQYACLYLFLSGIGDEELSAFTRTGRTVSMGILCGVLGINVAHELGHRSGRFEQFLSKSLLLTSLYLHFFIEHNRGHHRNVSTNADPASARYGESVYAFWLRSVVFSYLSAWRLEAERLKKKGKTILSYYNQMLVFQLIQILFAAAIYLVFGAVAFRSFLGSAAIGILLLETVNYIEHYGLRRIKTESGRYERVMPHHSWNSDHLLGRLLLFELSRHSDHHYQASRKYQLLRHYDESPQMPTGYPGMMLLALVPPLWFGIMHRRIARLAASREAF